MEDLSKYAHSPAHLAVLRRDYVALKRIVTALPRLAKAGDVNTEAESLAAEEDADAVSAMIDRRDVPGRETPLHLAVRLHDAISAEILMAAGADWSLQNDNGWSALQEAVCKREESIAMIIARHYQPLAWAKWCRRLPRIVASAGRIRDFYMEITFHFESSVIPFIGRIAPSDTYRIWKRGSNLRADMTLAGFDGFRIQRSDQTFLFLGEGHTSEDGNVSLPPGSLIVLAHKEKEITNALEGAGVQPSESEVAHEVTLMSQTNMYRPGIDVTQAELVPHLNWRRQERTEMVGSWKAKVYDMLHVQVSVKSRRVPGAMTDEELFSVNDDERLANGAENDEFDDVLTAEERMQLDSALRMGDGFGEDEDSEVQDCHENFDAGSLDSCESNGATKEKKSWFGWNKKSSKNIGDDPDDSKILKKFSKLAPDDSKQKANDSRRSSSEFPREEMGDVKKSKDRSSKKKKKKGATVESKNEKELLPLLDILANKVKAIRRLRELLTTKLPTGTFPVKIAIPIVPTIRVLVTFTKFEELQPIEEFSTPLSSPAHFQDSKSKESEGSTSWISWMRGSRGGQSSDSEGRSFRDEVDPFNIPADYAWVDANEKKRRLKAKKAKSRKHKKQHGSSRHPDGARRLSEDVEQ
ncbi:Ankyrin repeat family protein [Perilla frutescens var. frutescens]|nr:Ankyrin repeat family protein [Perilla frutescens var. frutescens]